MKFPFNILFSFFLILTLNLTAQNFAEIEGRIISKTSGEPLSYANIINLSTHSGTISNTDGYFRISLGSLYDTIRISFVGYRDTILQTEDGLKFYIVSLEESVQLLDEVVVVPRSNKFLYDLISECKKTQVSREDIAKAYFDLKSYRDSSQIELVEGYYNANISGYELTDLQLKAGRIALQTFNNHFFVSISTSKVIANIKLLRSNTYFPVNPVELSLRKLKKHFLLSLEGKYISGEADSIYVVEYIPVDTSGHFFSGKIWLNKTKKQFEKITFNSLHAAKHPFLPLFETDSIATVSFSITKTFRTDNGKPIFNHIDFVYKIDYKSRINKEDSEDYSIRTSAVLYAYDINNPFFIPLFDFNNNSTGDYHKINAMPYNEFFWNCNNEYKLNDSLNSNELFFNDSSSLTNYLFFRPNKYINTGFFKLPYVKWSAKRVMLRDMMTDTLPYEKTGIRLQQYDLSVKIFADWNSYHDSTNILTETIFDPYESYYHLPVDNQTLCFINIYFDLFEIKRRELEKELNNINMDPEKMMAVYKNFERGLETEKYKYFKAVDRGTNEAEMIKYNDFVFKNLRIDNIKIFRPYEESE